MSRWSGQHLTWYRDAPCGTEAGLYFFLVKYWPLDFLFENAKKSGVLSLPQCGCFCASEYM